MFYDVLSELCKKNKTSITAFALSEGCSKGAPPGWKKGSSPSADIVVKAARRFGVSADYLLELTNVPTPASNELSEKEWELLSAYRAADPKLKAAALAVLTSASPRYANAKLSTSQNSELPEAL